MTREEAIKIFNTVLFLGKCDAPKEELEECLKMAIKALGQGPILDKITEEIQALRGCSCWNSDGIIDDVEDIIDKYKAESEEEK